MNPMRSPYLVDRGPTWRHSGELTDRRRVTALEVPTGARCGSLS